jgi:Uncharacterized protein conserved in bacteria (DUF2332)
MTIAATYAEFAAREARGISPTYERLSVAVSGDGEMLSLLGMLPPAKRQPNLLFGVVRFLGGPVDDPTAFHDYAVANWATIEAEMRNRATQTNEAGRCALLLPVLAALPQPLALLDAGASAGLCLYPDRYSYRYGDHQIGGGVPILDCAATGMVHPAGLPTVVWRAGLDLNPLDASDPAQAAWLETLVWPEQKQRLANLRTALKIAAAIRPRVVRGDLLGDALEELCGEAPKDATLVVFHTAVLAYVADRSHRQAFAERAMRLSRYWISNETPRVFRDAALGGAVGEGAGRFVLSVNGAPVAWTDPHGASLQWIGSAA